MSEFWKITSFIKVPCRIFGFVKIPYEQLFLGDVDQYISFGSLEVTLEQIISYGSNPQI